MERSFMNAETRQISLNIKEMLIFNDFVELAKVRKLIAEPYCQVLLNIQSKIQSAMPERFTPSSKNHKDLMEDALEEAKNSIKPWTNFEIFFWKLLEDYERERKEDDGDDDFFPTVSNLTKELWGGFEDQTPYIYLDEDASPIEIIEAIKGYASEYQNGATWEVMDNLIHKMTYFELQQFSIYEMIDILNGVIYNYYRPDLDC